jgi:predicted porin
MLALALLVSGGAGAEDPPPRRFEFNGYATLGVVHSDEDRADFLGSLLIESGAGATDAWSAEVDSRVGAQLTATFTPALSAVVQVVSEQLADGAYTPHLEWANLKYQFSPDASVRVGRIVLPSFLVSDFRKVGYANPWVRPPNEVYSLVPITSSDGIDGSLRWHSGSFTHTLQAYLGQGDLEIPSGGDARGRDSMGFSATTAYGAWTARASYQQTRLTIENMNALFDAFRQFGSEGRAIAETYDVDGGPFRFYSVGGQYESGDWFFMAEWGGSESDSVVGERRAWYVSGGYRFGEVTPFLTYSTVTSPRPHSDPGLTVGNYPPELAASAAGLNLALNGLLASKPTQDTVSLGLRWDFAQNLDLKLQFDHSRLGSGSAGNLGNLQPGFRPGGRYNLISLAFDIVF